MDLAPAPRRLSPQDARRRCDPATLPFASTEELEDLQDALGQQRAADAIRFGIGVQRQGYNIFAMGPQGVGRHTIVRRLLVPQAAAAQAPSDWCYVSNFAVSHQPRALRLPAGCANGFQADVARLVDELRAAIPAAFETDEYRTRRREIESEAEDRQSEPMKAVGERARKLGIALLRTPAGFGFAPLQGDEVMEPNAFGELPEKEQERLKDSIAGLQQELESALQEMPKWRREAQHRLKDLNRQVTRVAVNSLLDELKSKYRLLPQVVAYLSSVQEDVLDHAELFQLPKDGEPPNLFGIPLPQSETGDTPLHRYQVNVLVANEAQAGAPVIYEDNPTHDNLVGRIEHLARMGALVTDFTLIKSGALHRANGGYLIIDAFKLLAQPFAWEALKRALRAREIRAESLGQLLSLVSTVSLQPEAIPLDVKVVLVGERAIYYLLHTHDPEFGELFKVVADFEEEVEREPQSDLLLARALATIARREQLRPLDRAAVACVIERAARDAGDAGMLSVQMRSLVDLLCEADHLAGASACEQVTAEHIKRALDSREHRAGRVRAKLQQEIQRGTLLIDTSGARSGQVNALAVMQLGGFAFGAPHRVTARARPGSGTLVDIEREAKLGGPIHSKGVLILAGFVCGRYAPKQPLTLAASLVFEQSYAGVEGDSASSAELYALLSAIADAPLRQSLAVTGSVNQHGDVQAVGGVNEKIEGFFDVCNARGLTSEQGVLIPASNARHLMLREDVVEAIAAGRFHVYPVATIDEGMEVLTGQRAGERDGLGRFPEGTLNARVERTLLDYAASLRPVSAAKSREPWRGHRQR